MTKKELYDILVNDERAASFLENDKYKKLYNYILSTYRSYKSDNVEPAELTHFLLSAGIDLFYEGDIFTMAFFNDKTLKTFDFSGIIDIGSLAFANSSIQSANLNDVERIGIGAFQSSDLSKVTLRQGVDIDQNAFARCKFDTIYIPDGATIATEAFYGCVGLKTVALDGEMISLKYHSFEDCRNIDTLFYHDGINEELLKYVFMYSEKKDIYLNVVPSAGGGINPNVIEDHIRNDVLKFKKFDSITVKEVE